MIYIYYARASFHLSLVPRNVALPRVEVERNIHVLKLVA
jgi:hypothetical protein